MKFGIFQEMKKHTLIHTKEKPYSCKECNKEFRHLSTFLKHKQNIHQKKFKCTFCLQNFQYKKALGKHVVEVHGQMKIYSCFDNSCGRVFHSQTLLHQHTLQHLGMVKTTIDNSVMDDEMQDHAQEYYLNFITSVTVKISKKMI